MKLTKQQKTILGLLGVAILVYILYKRSKSSKPEESGLTQEETSNQVATTTIGISALNDIKANMLEGGSLNDKWTNIGNGFFIPPGKSKRMAKKYIDGTIQYGYLISDNNQYRGGEEEDIVVGNKGGVDIIIKQKKYITVPSDKGIRKGDGNGNYFYFEELPEWKRDEIKKLEDLKAEADKAKAEADAIADAKAKEEARKRQEEKRRKFELAKKEAERKALEARLLSEKQAKESELAKQNQLAKEKSKKTTMIVAVLLVLGVVGFFVWKKYKK